MVLPFGCQSRRELPPGISYAGAPRTASDVRFLHDVTYVDDRGRRQVDQGIFDEMLAIIGSAERLLVLDMFLYNPFQGDAPTTVRALSEELTAALVARKRAVPALELIVITDPINTVYGGMESAQFERLRAAGIEVVMTKLDALRDSNPIYSMFWRAFVKPFGNSDGDVLPNPFGKGRVSVRSYLSLLNFKANHRKVLVADVEGELVGLVTSANPHDGSSAHTNVAIRFGGPAALDLLASENAVLELSGAEPIQVDWPAVPQHGELTVQVLTERKIKDVVLESIARAAAADRLDLAMFYLSDRDVIDALVDAAARGVRLRVLLDPNRDAFGRQKNGIPARPVAHELVEAGVPLRWCDTHGEQCHMKMLLVHAADGRSVLVAGSANFTRRNLENFNLETDVALRGPAEAGAIEEAAQFFDRLWRNEPGRRYSADYAAYADEAVWKALVYRFMEGSGISTF